MKSFIANAAKSLAAKFTTICIAARRGRAELATSAAIVAGWAFLTYGIVIFTTPKVWPLSVGLFLLAACGWRLLWRLASDGLYVLTRPRRG